MPTTYINYFYDEEKDITNTVSGNNLVEEGLKVSLEPNKAIFEFKDQTKKIFEAPTTIQSVIAFQNRFMVTLWYGNEQGIGDDRNEIDNLQCYDYDLNLLWKRGTAEVEPGYASRFGGLWINKGKPFINTMTWGFKINEETGDLYDRVLTK